MAMRDWHNPVRHKRESAVSLEQLRVQWSVEDRTSVVTLRGEVNDDARPTLRGIVEVASHESKLVIDLSEITYVDLTGVDLIVDLVQLESVVISNVSPVIALTLDQIGWTDDLDHDDW